MKFPVQLWTIACGAVIVVSAPPMTGELPSLAAGCFSMTIAYQTGAHCGRLGNQVDMHGSLMAIFKVLALVPLISVHSGSCDLMLKSWICFFSVRGSAM